MQISLQKQKLLFSEIVLKTGGVFIIYFLKVLWKFAISSGWFLSQKKKNSFCRKQEGGGGGAERSSKKSTKTCILCSIQTKQFRKIRLVPEKELQTLKMTTGVVREHDQLKS